MFADGFLAAFFWSRPRHRFARGYLFIHFRFGFGTLVLRQTHRVWLSIFVLYTKWCCKHFTFKPNCSPHHNPQESELCFRVGSGSRSKTTCQMEEGVIRFRKGLSCQELEKRKLGVLRATAAEEACECCVPLRIPVLHSRMCQQPRWNLKTNLPCTQNYGWGSNYLSFRELVGCCTPGSALDSAKALQSHGQRCCRYVKKQAQTLPQPFWTGSPCPLRRTLVEALYRGENRKVTHGYRKVCVDFDSSSFETLQETVLSVQGVKILPLWLFTNNCFHS